VVALEVRFTAVLALTVAIAVVAVALHLALAVDAIQGRVTTASVERAGVPARTAMGDVVFQIDGALPRHARTGRVRRRAVEGNAESGLWTGPGVRFPQRRRRILGRRIEADALVGAAIEGDRARERGEARKREESAESDAPFADRVFPPSSDRLE